MSNKFDYDVNKLATTDMEGSRIYLFPEDVRGKWLDRRSLVYLILILVYLVLPWIYYKGEQAIRLNLVEREFSFFGYIFYAHDAPLILLLLLGFVFAIGFITSLWGRVWCGWGCPQTVFITFLYSKVERLIEGRARERSKLAESPWNTNKILKKSLKWFIFLILSLHISHSLLGYYVGTRELFFITLDSPMENLGLFITMLVITSIFLFDFGWFKEQFCIIACPYGRLQSVIMDSYSKVVGYDYNRGEPRRSKDIEKGKEGDCINCYHCVKVCPTGIEIRNGTQLECIACTACIDACDEIMEKVHKPKGLIRYTTEAELEKLPQQKFKLRSLIYFSIILIISSVFIYSLQSKSTLNLRMNKIGRSSYIVLKDNQIDNLYRINFDNKTSNTFKIYISSNNPLVKIKTKKQPLEITSGEVKTIMHLTFPKEILENGSKDIKLFFKDKEINIEREIKLVGPFK